jgi:hypothetical protein
VQGKEQERRRPEKEDERKRILCVRERGAGNRKWNVRKSEHAKIEGEIGNKERKELPPMSLLQVANLLSVYVIYTGGLCISYREDSTTSVNDTGRQLAPVSLTPVVRLDLRIFPRIF